MWSKYVQASDTRDRNKKQIGQDWMDEGSKTKMAPQSVAVEAHAGQN
jgi:hypothetical protein